MPSIDDPVDWGVCIVTDVNNDEYCVCRVTRAHPETEFENTAECVVYFGSYSSRDDAMRVAEFLNGVFSLIETE